MVTFRQIIERDGKLTYLVIDNVAQVSYCSVRQRSDLEAFCDRYLLDKQGFECTGLTYHDKIGAYEYTIGHP